VIISGIQVVKIVMHPKLPINPGIIAFAPECHSEIGRALAAHAISLAPGELLIEMARDGTMYIHSLDVEASERLVKASQNVRRDLLKKIFD
jgi:multicomponent Na+:H+ antiporter subunit E